MSSLTIDKCNYRCSIYIYLMLRKFSIVGIFLVWYQLSPFFQWFKNNSTFRSMQLHPFFYIV
jgi:hypothetical protein